MVEYRDDVRREGEPRTSKREGSPLGGALTENLGPLPVWGWAAVAVGAVFLYRRMTAKGAAASATPTVTMPAYPAGPDAGTIINDYRTDTTAAAPAAANAVLPTVTPGKASGWGPSYPDKAPGVVPDRPCPPGQFVVTSFEQNWWSCETYAQIGSLLAYLGTLGAPPASATPSAPPAGSGPSTATCPSGYTLVNAATGLSCVKAA